MTWRKKINQLDRRQQLTLGVIILALVAMIVIEISIPGMVVLLSIILFGILSLQKWVVWLIGAIILLGAVVGVGSWSWGGSFDWIGVAVVTLYFGGAIGIIFWYRTILKKIYRNPPTPKTQ